jgi:hypothetical protein
VNASIIVSVCATIIAVVSLGVAVYQARATRRHNRLTVRPILELRTNFRVGQTAGLQLLNVGIGPAAVTKTRLTLDGEHLGEFDESGVNRVRETLTAIRPSAVTLGGRPYLAKDYSQYLLSVPAFDPVVHSEFIDLVRSSLAIEIHYESVYGGEGFMIRHPRRN